MTKSDIKFSNGAKPKEGDDPALVAAQFAAFSALCHVFCIAKYINRVDFRSSWCGYEIEMDAELEHTDVEDEVWWTAEQTLSQFSIFNRVGHKRMIGNA
jgi:hypothetical protein